MEESTKENEKEIIFNLNKNSNYCELILNRPQKLNAITGKMFLEILEIVGGICENVNYNENFIPFVYKKREFKKIPEVIYILSKGKNFCSGGDISEIYYKAEEKNYDYILNRNKLVYTLLFNLKSLKIIKIAEWDGYVMGGGVGITINSQIRICNDTTCFCMPECGLGNFPDMGAAYFYTSLLNNNKSLGLYAGLTGHKFKGKEVFNCGLGNVFIQKEKIPDMKKEIENLCNTNEKVDLDSILEIITKNGGEIYDKTKFKFEYESLINEIFVPDNIFNIFKRLKNKIERTEIEKLTPGEIKFLKDTLISLENASPLSLLIYTEYFKIVSKYKSIEDCYISDEKFCPKIMYSGDFCEGVRSIIIDKDKKPNFMYKTIYDIKDYKNVIKKFLDNIVN